jgi:two-component system, NtrC family, sensor histidine kinase PilS
MENLNFTVVIFSFLFLVVILLSIFRALINYHRKKVKKEEKDTTQVGFVVDTFHELVARLKEKERELEELKRKAEDRASSVEIYNEDILQSVPSGVISFDRDLIVTKMNSAAGNILDLKEGDVIGKGYASVFSGRVADIIGEQKTVDRAEIACVTPGGKRIWLGLNMSPLKDSSKNTIGQILVFTDLTELKAFQSQMELRERLANLGEMSAGIAHELRNPLGVISGYTKILLKKADSGSVAAVEAIAKEVEVMDRIISDFLSFARPTELVQSEVDLGELISGCIQGVEDSAKGVRIVFEQGALAVIRADEVLLRQSVTNLIRNAVEATPEGGEVRISGRVDDFLHLSVSDTGHGMAENIRDKIFLPFYTTKERGTGLGLSIVHKVVVSHGGTIDVESSEKGTTFTINLPSALIVNGKDRE